MLISTEDPQVRSRVPLKAQAAESNRGLTPYVRVNTNRDTGRVGGHIASKEASAGFMLSLWRRGRRVGALSYQIWILLIGLVLAVPTLAQDQQDVKDVTFKSGQQLEKQFLTDIQKNEDLSAAVRYFGERKMKPELTGLAEFEFQKRNSPGQYKLTFVPFSSGDPAAVKSEQHIVASAQGPKGSHVYLATIEIEKGKRPEVKEEAIVTGGKVTPNKAKLTNFFKCAGSSCGPAALGCMYGGPEWLPCFCLWCGGGAVSCGVLELFD